MLATLFTLYASPVVTAQAAKGAVQGSVYDYVIVGGGTSGLVVANRLAEDPRTTVLVIERGSFDNKPQAAVPWYANELDESVLMSPQSAPIPELNNATWSVAVAAVVGGGSVVNGMAYNRGSKDDYDAWERLGNPGWGWKGLLPYFLKSATFTPPSPELARRWNITWNPSVYGNGPVRTHIPDFQYPDIAVFWDALRHEFGVELPPGANAGLGPGAFWTPSTIDARTMTRSTSRSAYYDPVKARPNLDLLTGQTATKILLDSDPPLQAIGVRLTSRFDKTIRNVYARKEVILAAGAIQTPQLLQASGIGPVSVLQAAGVDVKKDLPAVGANLQDHATALLLFSLSNQSFPNPDTITNNATYNATVWAEYLTNRTGPISAASASTLVSYSLTQLIPNTSSFTKELLAQDATIYLPAIYRASPGLLQGFLAQRAVLAAHFTSPTSAITATPFLGNGFAPSALLHPLSRGTVTLNLKRTHPSDDDDDDDNDSGLPTVQYNTFQNPLDARVMVSLARHLRAFFASPQMTRAFEPIVEIRPGADAQTDAEILAALKAGVGTGTFWPSLAHPCGTCAMLPEGKGGCVDARLRVYGVVGLRVVDASVLPLVVGAPLQATVYAVAEKAADLIKLGWGGS